MENKFTAKSCLRRANRIIQLYLRPSNDAEKNAALTALRTLREKAATEYMKFPLRAARNAFVVRFNSLISQVPYGLIEPFVVETKPETIDVKLPPIDTSSLPFVTVTEGDVKIQTLDGFRKGQIVYDKKLELYGKIIELIHPYDIMCAKVCHRNNRGIWCSSLAVRRTDLIEPPEHDYIDICNYSWDGGKDLNGNRLDL